ncbi:MAG: FAD-dependent oxidoreductase, partial [Actinomycetota bacterium]|nr:FAD-dependent oxidoreductase [Actinomycetota bacterium]
MTNHPRLVVVGGGILGTMHAVEAVARGYEVVQIERDGEPRGASVRNFGLVWVSGRAEGAELALALRSRELWQEVVAGLPDAGFRPNGSLTIARSRAELDVLEEVAARSDARERGFALLAPDEIRRLHPAVGGSDVVGARAHAVRDDTGEWHSGDLVVCCIRATPSRLLAQELAGAPLRCVRLQMLETAPFAGPLDATIADGDSDDSDTAALPR